MSEAKVTIPATDADVAHLRPADAAIMRTTLDSIVVGCVTQGHDEFINIQRVAGNIPKLNGANWAEWQRIFRTMITAHISYGRGLGLLDGSPAGTVPAYQRYFGTAAQGTKDAVLCSEASARAAREREDSSLASLLYMTVDPSQHHKFTNDEPQGEGVGSIMYRNLVKKFTMPTSVTESVLHTKLENFLPNVNLPLQTNIDYLKGLFRDLVQLANTRISETMKINHLIKLATNYPGFEDEARWIHNSFLGDQYNRTFESIERQLVSIEQKKAASAYGQMAYDQQQPFRPQGMAPLPQPQRPGIMAGAAQHGYQGHQQWMQLSTSPTDSYASSAASSTPSSPTSLRSNASLQEREDLAAFYGMLSSQYASRDGNTADALRAFNGNCWHCGARGHTADNCKQKASGAVPRDQYQKRIKDQEREGYRAPGASQAPRASIWLPGNMPTQHNRDGNLPTSLSAWDTYATEEEEQASVAAAFAAGRGAWH